MQKSSIFDISSSLYGAVRRKGLYPGEMHGLLKKPDGTFSRAKYMGPGTHVLKRIKDGDKPLTQVDKVAQAHDIRYWLSNTAQDARNADVKMNRKVDEIQKLGADNLFNIAQAKLIKAKTVLEDIGMMKKGSFSGYDVKYDANPDDKKIMVDKLKNLELEGFGRRMRQRKRRQRVKKRRMNKKKEEKAIKKYEKRGVFEAHILTKKESADLKKLIDSFHPDEPVGVNLKKPMTSTERLMEKFIDTTTGRIR